MYRFNQGGDRLYNKRNDKRVKEDQMLAEHERIVEYLKECFPDSAHLLIVLNGKDVAVSFSLN